jgi:hypothetical protein
VAHTRPAPQPPRPAGGPGTELKALLAELGIVPTRSCECNRKAEEMDRLGVGGVRRDRDRIVAWLREAQRKRSWGQQLAAAAKALASGLAWKLDPLDPAPGILEEALRRAGAKRGG